MDQNRFTQWLGTVEGLTKALTGALGSIAALIALIKGWLDPLLKHLGLPPYVGQIAIVAALAVFLALLWRSYRRFARFSRLERPEKFVLAPTTPDSLIGRDDDLKLLQASVTHNRIVLLDGESGCGKSALVSAGLVPRLRAGDAFVPVLVRDWNDEWIRGPLAAALEALRETLDAEQTSRIGWDHAPDLAGDTAALLADLALRLDAVRDVLGRRSVLIADQFDDYQTQHRDCFLDAHGNWLTPAELAVRNPFWALVSTRLAAGSLHLLAVTRSDSASGLSCLQFIPGRNRPLRRVETSFLHPLLTRLADPDVSPPVVSNPEDGWEDLCKRLEADFRQRGAILMQQVRTVLLGLAEMPMLTPCAYRRAGEMGGVERLAVKRAIEAAGEALGGGEANVRIARTLLNTLVLPGGPDQTPKAQRQPVSDLARLVGGADRAELALEQLRRRDMVRRVGGEASVAAWQLDHDYLTGPVLAERRQADRWGSRLEDGLARFKAAGDDRRRQWHALLPIAVQARLVWERLHGHLRYHEAAAYARLSAIKPALMLVILAGAEWGVDRAYERTERTWKAEALLNRFGPNGEAATLEVWQSPKPLRLALLKLIEEDTPRRLIALYQHWPRAQVGFEQDQLRDVATLLLPDLTKENDPGRLTALDDAYTAVGQRLRDETALKKAAAAMRIRMLHDNTPYDRSPNFSFDNAYVAIVSSLRVESDREVEADAWRALMQRPEINMGIRSTYAGRYVTVARFFDNQAARAHAALLLRKFIEMIDRDPQGGGESTHLDAYDLFVQHGGIEPWMTDEAKTMCGHIDSAQKPLGFMDACAAITQMIGNQVEIAKTLGIIRTRAARDHVVDDDLYSSEVYDDSYIPTVRLLELPDVIISEAKAIRLMMDHETDMNLAVRLAEAYVAVSARSADTDIRKTAAEALWKRLCQEKKESLASSFATYYAEMARASRDPDTINRAAGRLADRMEHTQISQGRGDLIFVSGGKNDGGAADTFAAAYAEVAQELEGKALADAFAILKNRMDQESTPANIATFLEAYSILARKLRDPGIIRTEAAAMRQKLEDQMGNYIDVPMFAEAYAAVAQNQRGDALSAAVQTLRELLVQQKGWGELDSYADPYAAVARKLAEPDLSAEEDRLRGLIETQTESGHVDGLAKVYAAVASSLLKVHANEPERLLQISRSILTMAGQPFLTKFGPLMDALEPVIPQAFRTDPGTAAAWWSEHFRQDPATLRPTAH